MSTQLPINVILPWLSIQPQNAKSLYDAVKSRLEERHSYKVTEETRYLATNDKKELGELQDTLHKERMRVFAEYEKTKQFYIDTEKLLKNRKDELNAGIKKLDEAETNRKLQEKWDSIRIYFESLDCTLCTLEELLADFNWKLVKNSIPVCQKEIAKRVDTINKELSLIDSMAYTAEEKLEVQNLYLSNLDLTGAIQQFEENKAKREALLQRQQAVFAQKTPPREVVQEQTQQIQTETKVSSNVAENVATTRLVVEFVVQGRDFLDYMNAGIREFHPKVRIIEREEI